MYDSLQEKHLSGNANLQYRSHTFTCTWSQRCHYVKNHVKSRVKSCFLHLRNITRIRPLLFIFTKFSSFLSFEICVVVKSSDGPINRQIIHNLPLNSKLIRERLKEIHWKLVEFNVNRFTLHKEQYKANRGLDPGIKNLMQNHKTLNYIPLITPPNAELIF